MKKILINHIADDARGGGGVGGTYFRNFLGGDVPLGPWNP